MVTVARAMEPHPNPTIVAGLLTACGVIFAAMVGAVGVWFANRLLGKAAFQQAINAGFTELLREARMDRDALRKDLTKERIACDQQLARLNGAILNLTASFQGLKRILRAHNIEIPADWSPTLDPKNVMTTLVKKEDDRP